METFDRLDIVQTFFKFSSAIVELNEHRVILVPWVLRIYGNYWLLAETVR